MGRRDNARQVRAGRRSTVGTGQPVAQRRGKGLQHRGMDADMVGRDADLARVDALAKGDPVGGLAQVGIGADDHRRLAAQFQRDRRQRPRRCCHHDPAHRRAAGKEDVVEGQPKQPFGHRLVAFDHGHEVGWKGFAHHPRDQGAGRGRQFRRL